jgi:hypothetical protein
MVLFLDFQCFFIKMKCVELIDRKVVVYFNLCIECVVVCESEGYHILWRKVIVLFSL